MIGLISLEGATVRNWHIGSLVGRALLAAVKYLCCLRGCNATANFLSSSAGSYDCLYLSIIILNKAVEALRVLVAGFLPRRPGFVTRLIHVVTKWHWDRFYSGSFGFALSPSFHCFYIFTQYRLGLHKGLVTGRSSKGT